MASSSSFGAGFKRSNASPNQPKLVLKVKVTKAPSAKTINAPVPKLPSRVVRCLVIAKPMPPPRNMYSPRKMKPSTVGNHNIAMAVQPSVRFTGSSHLPNRMRTPARKLHSTSPKAATPNHL